MIEQNGKKYYTTYELVKLITDSTTELSQAWQKYKPNYQNVILLEQVCRIVYEGKKKRKISVVEFTKSEKASKKYYAFLLDDVINYLSSRESDRKVYNVKVIEKE